MTSCENENLEEPTVSTLPKDEVKFENGKLHFNSKESLNQFLKNSPKEEFKSKIREFQSSGFSSLKPIFLETETDLANSFMVKKAARLKKANFLYSKSGFNKDEIDDDDEIITDPNFASILNDERSIYVGDEVFVYTTQGAFFSKIEHEQLLKKYLDSIGLLTEAKFKQSFRDPYSSSDCNGNMYRLESSSTGIITQVTDEISLYTNCGGSFGGGSTGGGTTGGGTTSTTTNKYPYEKKQAFGTCTIEGESLWQMVFGPAETCYDYFDDERRVKVKFWNQNYLVFSSIGMSTKFQKKYWAGWQKSDAVDFTELGINFAEFTYEYNVPQYNVFKIWVQ